jgi:hypothetical protein
MTIEPASRCPVAFNEGNRFRLNAPSASALVRASNWPTGSIEAIRAAEVPAIAIAASQRRYFMPCIFGMRFCCIFGVPSTCDAKPIAT